MAGKHTKQQLRDIQRERRRWSTTPGLHGSSSEDWADFCHDGWSAVAQTKRVHRAEAMQARAKGTRP